MNAWRLAPAAVFILVLLASTSALAGPDGSLIGVPSGLLTLSPADDLYAIADLSAQPDPSSQGTQHYGPFSSTSPDSGTCGNDWATDTFDRHFTVKTNPDGTFLVTEQFKNGSFVTNPPTDNESPGSCEPGGTPGTVNTGTTGNMHGYFLIPIVGSTQSSTSPYCNAMAMTNTGCTTTIFIDTHFFPPCYGPGTCTVTTFFFHYSAGDQSLVEHEWKNASADRGGNHGDIRSMNLP
jgi:hypothetical protein